MEIKETTLGFEVETNNLVAVFGNKSATIEALKKNYPNWSFARIKQTHGDRVVESQHSTDQTFVEADAHFTTKTQLGLCISTADCIPILIYHHKTKTIAAIHAGWRGVANQILEKTVLCLQKQGGHAIDLQFLIGPHIQVNSFEVENTVRDQILNSLADESAREICYQPISATKSLVDLNLVLRLQVQSLEVPPENVLCLHIDTVTDQRFHSFRRDRENSGRQLSFIVLQ